MTPASLPVHVLTGFLGSGKTSLLNAALREPALAGTAVLINELGEIAIDHDLVAEVEPDLVVTTTGCLCCTAGSDVASSLAVLRARWKAGEIPPFTRVILETTGLADPAPIVNALIGPLEDGETDRNFHLAGVMTLFDTLAGDDTLDEHLEALKQVALADTVVLTKTDLVCDPATPRDLTAIGHRLLAINPHLGPRQSLLDRHADWPRVVARLTSEAPYDTAGLNENALGWLDAEAVLAHNHAHAAAAEPGRHDDRVRSHVLSVDEPLDPRGFYLFLEMLKLSAGAKILRLKGLFALADDPDRPLVVHGVQHVIYPLTRLERWPSADRRSRLVLIGRDLKPEIIQRMLSTLKPKAPRPLGSPRVSPATKDHA